MMKIYYRILTIFVVAFLAISCEGLENPIFDTENGRALAGFNGNNAAPNIIFNPAADTENIITVGVSTTSSSDRSVQLTLDQSATTLDNSFYSISSLNPVIPAGQFTTDVIITTFGSTDLPDSDAVIALSLDSVEGAEILADSEDNLQIGISVMCPSTDIASIPGTYQIVVDEFGTSVGDDQFEIVAGPGENQVTMVNPFDHPNPDAGGAQNYEVVVSIDPSTGTATVPIQGAWHYSNFAATPVYGEGRVNGSGLSLTCIGQLQFTLTNTVDAGSFGSYALVVQKL